MALIYSEDKNVWRFADIQDGVEVKVRRYKHDIVMESTVVVDRRIVAHSKKCLFVPEQLARQITDAELQRAGIEEFDRLLEAHPNRDVILEHAR